MFHAWLLNLIVCRSLYRVCSSFFLPFLQKRQPLPLSPPSYPHHGSEVNGGFQSAYTPPINGTDGIMGKKPCSLPFIHQRSVARHVLSSFPVQESSLSFMWACSSSVFLSVLSGNRGNAAGSSGDEIGKALASVSYISLDLIQNRPKKALYWISVELSD